MLYVLLSTTIRGMPFIFLIPKYKRQQILIIENRFNVFQNIPHCMRLNQLSKHICHSDWGISKICILNASNASSGIEKRWPLILFFTYGNKMKSFDAKSGLYGGFLIKSMFWVLKNVFISRCVRARIVVAKEWSVFLLRSAARSLIFRINFLNAFFITKNKFF